MARDKEIKFEIINTIGTISVSKSGWKKEINRISWNGAEPKYDIRDWDAEHTKMGKGITLSENELRELFNILTKEVEYLDSE